MESRYVNILRHLGQTLFLDEVSRNILMDLDSGGHIMDSGNWSEEQITSFTDEELIDVFRGLIIAEQCYKDLGGSASVGKFLYREIEERNIDQDLRIANWAYILTRNGYIPFDSDGRKRREARDAFEFMGRSREGIDPSWIQSKYSNQTINESDTKEVRDLKKRIFLLEEEVSRQETAYCNLKEIKALEEKMVAMENVFRQNRETIRHQKEMLELCVKDAKEIAQLILADTSKPINYYYYAIERTLYDKSVGKIVLESLLEKFKRRERGNVKILKARLVKEISNR